MKANAYKWLAPALVAMASLAAAAHTGSYDTKPAIDYSKAEEHPFGKAADPKKAKRVVNVEMSDTMRFNPGEITVKRGETVRFVAKNTGKVMHEMVLGTKQELAEHAEMMQKHPGMEHDEPHMLHVAPGKSGEMGWQFTQPGEFLYGCLVPGHYEAGMVGKVIVVADGASPGLAGPKGAAASAAVSADFADGEVRKVDKAAGKVTLKHGPLTNLGMPAMTMVFRVKDAAMLDSLKVGDKVRFKADKILGAYTIVEVQGN